jgi:hypothetical protein
MDGGVVAEARHQRYPLQVSLTIKHHLFRDGIRGHQFNDQDSSLLLHAIHSPFSWQIFKKCWWIRDILVRIRMRGSVPLTTDKTPFFSDLKDAKKMF